MTRAGARRSVDRGASLTIVMIVVVGFGLVTGALLTYAMSAITSAGATAAANQRTSDVATALQAAINDVRNSTYFNNVSAGETCLSGTGEKSYPDGSGGTLTITCNPDPGTGAAGGLVPVNNTNKPSLALLTLGTGGEPGLEKNGNSVLSIKGSVYSNSTIATNNGNDCPETPQPPATGANCNEVYVLGASVTAESNCTGRIIATGTPGLLCATGTHSSAGDDPGLAFPAAYAQPTSSMTPATLPACSTDPVVFEPGYYDDAEGLSDRFKNNGACAGKTRWFKPGNYYFDFHNEETSNGGAPVVPYVSNAKNKWVVDDPNGFIIGGTKKGWTAAVAAVPGACVSPLESTANPGVTFVFGGNSRFEMQRGQMEICGTWSTNKPPIAVYGAKTLTGSAEQTATLRPAGIGTTGNPKNYSTNNPALNGIRNESDSGAGPLATGVGQNKTVTLFSTSMDGLSAALPQRAYLESAVLTVRHGEKNATSATQLSVDVKVNKTGATVVSQPLQVTPGAVLGWRTEQFDLGPALRNDLYSYGASALAPFATTVTLKTDNADNNVDSQVDYVKLVVTYRDIAVRAQSGCVTTVCVGGCPQFATNSTPGKELYIQGTAYLPKAQIDVTLNNISGQVFRSGLIARSALLSITSSSTYAGPVIELPDNTLAPTPLAVFFTAWSCPGGGCAAPASAANGWVLNGRSKVTYTDLTFSPVSGQRNVTVNSWTVTR